MIIGVPKEIKNHEYRVGIVPDTVRQLAHKGHDILIEKGAGLGSFITDDTFVQAGAAIIETPQEIYSRADMIVKVKEPLPSEYSLIRPGQIIFTFFHFASSRELTDAMIKSRATCISYETIEKADHSLPVLAPMSEIAGRLSVQEGAKYLERAQGGRGVLLGGVPGVQPGTVVIVGAGVVGTQAALMAAGLQADVYLFDINLERLRFLSLILPKNITLLYPDHYTRYELIKKADLLIGAVLVPGARAPNLVTREMLGFMKKQSVIVDVAIDQGGCVETSRPTTHDDPIYVEEDIVHYCVANMPGAVPCTSTQALNIASSPYILQIADMGLDACRKNMEIRKGLNIYDGRITYSPVAEAFGYEYVTIENALSF